MLPKSVDIRRAPDMKRGSVEDMTVSYVYMNSGYEQEEKKKVLFVPLSFKRQDPD